MQNEMDQLHWIRRCADTACVEVARNRDVIHVRDSKNIGGPVLTFTLEQWRSFLAAVAAGEFDRG